MSTEMSSCLWCGDVTLETYTTGFVWNDQQALKEDVQLQTPNMRPP